MALGLPVGCGAELPDAADAPPRAGGPLPGGSPPGGAEDLREQLPDLVTLPPSEIVLRRGDGGRLTLRFTNRVANVGADALELRARPEPGSRRVTAFQRIYRSDGGMTHTEVGQFVFDHAHRHWHFDDFARYEVWMADAQGRRVRRVAARGKVTFCLRDSAPLSNFPRRAPRRYDCRPDVQGTSVGWVDVYPYSLAGQALDLGDAPSGRYWLISTADPRRHLREITRANNTAAALIHVDREGGRVRTLRRVAPPSG